MNEKQRFDKINKLRITLRKEKRMLGYYEIKRKKYYDLYWEKNHKVADLENEICKLKHKYEKGDLVYLKERNEIAKILSLIGAKQYKVFAYLSSSCGTEPIINETDITCKVEVLPRRFDLVEKKAVLVCNKCETKAMKVKP